MNKRTLLVNDQNSHTSIHDDASIQRCPHDESNRYSIISNSLIRDKNISPDCRWLIMYLLSNKETWVINAAQIVDHVKDYWGRDKAYAVINEAIESGYMKRDEIRRKNPKGGSLKSFKYTVSESPKFKKCFRHPENQDTGDQDPGFPHIKNTIDKKDYSKEILITPPIPPQEIQPSAVSAKADEERIEDPPKTKRARTPSEFTPRVKELAEKMVNALHVANPDWLIPINLHPMMVQLDEMLNLEKRDPKKILDVFMWAVCDSFWMDKLCKPNPAKYLRQQFAQLSGKMNSKPPQKERKFAPCSNDQRAIEKMEEMRKHAL